MNCGAGASLGEIITGRLQSILSSLSSTGLKRDLEKIIYFFHTSSFQFHSVRTSDLLIHRRLTSVIQLFLFDTLITTLLDIFETRIEYSQVLDHELHVELEGGFLASLDRGVALQLTKGGSY